MIEVIVRKYIPESYFCSGPDCKYVWTVLSVPVVPQVGWKIFVKGERETIQQIRLEGENIIVIVDPDKSISDLSKLPFFVRSQALYSSMTVGEIMKPYLKRGWEGPIERKEGGSSGL